MGFRVGTINGRKGYYVFVDRPSKYSHLKGSKTERKKGGDTEAEAKRNALRIEAELLAKWEGLLNGTDPLKAAKQRSVSTGLSFEDALDDELRDRQYTLKAREDYFHALQEPQQLLEQGIEVRLSRHEKAKLDAAVLDLGTYQDWIELRKIELPTRKNTHKRWLSHLKSLATWLGTDQVGVITRKQAHNFKIYLLQTKGSKPSTVHSMISTYTAFFEWAKTAGQITTENPWTGLKKGLSTKSSREPLDPAKLKQAEAKADELQDIRFWFGRYQGLRKGEYCGLRWSDIDMENETFRLVNYVHKGKTRNIKTEGSQRVVPMHSQLVKRIKKYLPEASTRYDNEPIWGDDYKEANDTWGATWAEGFTRRYGFGSHDLRALVVTMMLEANINEHYIEAITGHAVQGSNKVLSTYNVPTLERVRKVLEQLE